MDKLKESLDNLNTEQKEAVYYSGKSLLILAGAGSGKTRVITTKIAYLIKEKNVAPESILAVTFTNKAAQEMRERVFELLGESNNFDNFRAPLIKTFHSFGAWLIRRNSSALGIPSHFKIYDDDDMLSMLSVVCKGKTKKELKPYANWISRSKDFFLNPDDELRSITYDDSFPEIYKLYEKAMAKVGNLDFGDLIKKTVDLLVNNPVIRDRIQKRFKYILVDEYQDSNIAQFELLKALYSPESNLCVVGDDDQSIYKFRGAEINNILGFSEVFPGTEMIKLEKNYRSTGNILEIASGVISNNSSRLGKTLWTDSGAGNKAELAILGNHEDEARYCADKILKSGNYENSAILYRTNSQSLIFENIFTNLGLPYKIVGSLRFYEREEVKDAISLLSLLMNPKDSVAFTRIINKPARGIGKATVTKIIDLSNDFDGDLIKASDQAKKMVSARARNNLSKYIENYKSIKTYLETMSLADFIKTALEKNDFLEYYKTQDKNNGTSKLNNLQVFISNAYNYGSGISELSLFLEEIELNALRSQAAENEFGVTLITLHNTKGLEFDNVFITGLEEGLFPSLREGNDDEEIEEERRLFYVGITRAKKELHLTSVRRRLIWGRFTDMLPSRFIDELPSACIQAIGSSVKSNTKWKKGVRVYHDEYGVGTIFKEWYNGSELLVFVQFETGRTAQFIPKYSNLDIISSEDY